MTSAQSFWLTPTTGAIRKLRSKSYIFHIQLEQDLRVFILKELNAAVCEGLTGEIIPPPAPNKQTQYCPLSQFYNSSIGWYVKIAAIHTVNPSILLHA